MRKHTAALLLVGMGFVVMNNRISYSLVITLLLKAGTYMPIFFTLMLSFTKVESEEQTLAAEELTEVEEESLLANMTCGACPAVARCPVC